MKRGYSIKGKPKKNHEEKISMIQYFFLKKIIIKRMKIKSGIKVQ
jgi:hypothetical protein